MGVMGLDLKGAFVVMIRVVARPRHFIFYFFRSIFWYPYVLSIQRIAFQEQRRCSLCANWLSL